MNLKAKYKVMLVAQGSAKCKYRLGEKWVEGSLEEDLAFWWMKSLI